MPGAQLRIARPKAGCFADVFSFFRTATQTFGRSARVRSCMVIIKVDRGLALAQGQLRLPLDL